MSKLDHAKSDFIVLKDVMDLPSDVMTFFPEEEGIG